MKFGQRYQEGIAPKRSDPILTTEPAGRLWEDFAGLQRAPRKTPWGPVDAFDDELPATGFGAVTVVSGSNVGSHYHTLSDITTSGGSQYMPVQVGANGLIVDWLRLV